MNWDRNLRLGETEYVGLIDPAHAHETPFGTFYAHPEFPDRYDANQLCRVRCGPDATDGLLAHLEELYEPLGLAYRKVSGADPAVWAHLGPELEARGWMVARDALLLFTGTPTYKGNQELTIRAVGPDSRDLAGLYTNDRALDRGFQLARSQFVRVGGEYLVGHLEGRPACCCGWFPAGGLVRFRHVLTAPWARGRGCATRLIRHVQDHPEVRERDGLVILVSAEGPRPLYEALGFRVEGWFWEARLRPDL